jgi:hypothetical protein
MFVMQHGIKVKRMKAVHLLCRREGLGFKGLELVTNEKGVYRSCCWAFGESSNPHSLVGGWAYLHPVAKSAPSEFGGIVRAIEPSKRAGKSIEEGYILVIEARREGKGQPWRGADHPMAWTSGIIDASLPHETNESSA